MVKAADRAAEIGANALQVFCDNPMSWARRESLPAELDAFRARLAAGGIAPLVVHASYLVNLAGDDPAFRERSVAVLIAELRTAAAYGASLLNLHVGSHRGLGIEVGIRHVAEGVEQALAGVDGEPGLPRLVLENSAGGGFTLGTSVEELAAIDAAILGRGIPRDRIGYCLDTAHAWGAGLDLRDPGAVDAFLGDFGSAIGRGRLVLVHLNDSRAELGSRADRHEHLGAGLIGETGLRTILAHPALAAATYVLETPGMDEGYDAVNLGRARDIAAGRPLEPLPPDAFEVRSSRAHAAPAALDVATSPTPGLPAASAG